MIRELPFTNINGHIIVDLDGKNALIDTGSPGSMSPEPFMFMGAQRVPPQNIMDVTTGQMSGLAGFPIHILIGCDMLREFDLLIRWRDGALELGNNIMGQKQAHPMSELMGIPVFPVTIAGKETKALLDTGAHISYINSEAVANEQRAGTKKDFYPMVGSFTTDLYVLPTGLDGRRFDLNYGILPDALQMMMGIAMQLSSTTAFMGTEIFSHFDCLLSWQRGRILWKPHN